MTEVGQIVLAFISGGAIASIVTVIYTTSHERKERLRERMITAASTFLSDVEHLHVRLIELDAKAALHAKARQRMRAIFAEIGELPIDERTRFEDASDLGSTLARAYATVERNWSLYTDRPHEAELDEIRQLIRVHRPVLNELLGPRAGAMLDTTLEYTEAAIPYYKASDQVQQEIQLLVSRLAAVILIFSGPRDEVSLAGTEILMRATEIAKKIDESAGDEEGTLTETGVAQIGLDISKFATAAAGRIRRRRP